MEPVTTTGTVQPVHDLSFWNLFLEADIIVQGVIVALIIASIWSWTIIFSKAATLRTIRKRTKKFEEAFMTAGSLEDLYNRMGGQVKEPMAAMFSAGMREWSAASTPGTSRISSGLRDRLERVVRSTMYRETDKLNTQLPFLATVGSTAPFIGLFGTVWGIMNSFQAIAGAKSASLNVVAPGIAEALFATAIGLVAAIPAVMAYNRFMTSIGRYEGRLEGFSDDFITQLSRQLDRAAAA